MAINHTFFPSKGGTPMMAVHHMMGAHHRFFFIDPRANDYISYKAGQGFPLSGS